MNLHRWLMGLAAGWVSWVGCAVVCAQPLPAGKGQFTFQFLQHELEVFTYRPTNYTAGPLIVVLHGMNRNAADYRDHAMVLGDRFGALVAAPRFDTNHFPAEAYQRGGLTRKGAVQSPGQWTVSAISQLVAAVRARENRTAMPYYLIGHSAGGQFLVRLAALVPGEAQRIVAGNPGSHLFPTRELPFQYGFGKLPEELSNDEALQRYLAAPLTLFLGTADLGEKDLDQSATAMKQGATRIERGRNAYRAGEKLAREKGWPFNWSIVEVPGVGHDSKKLFAHPLAETALFSGKCITEPPSKAELMKRATAPKP